jgi:hypothetical protein
MNIEAININPSNKSWIDKLIRSLEILSFVLIAFPFASMALWILTSAFLKGDYFFFFPIAMFTFLPTGIFALLVQLFRALVKRKLSLFGFLLLGSSIITIFIGIIAWMAIYVAVG